jgi:hypothetical protein
VIVINREEGWIGHRLNILGVRVWADKCQLIARSGAEWLTLGPPKPLPIQVPANAEELSRAARDPLLITAYQILAEHPGSKLAALLFPSAMNISPR